MTNLMLMLLIVTSTIHGMINQTLPDRTTQFQYEQFLGLEKKPFSNDAGRFFAQFLCETNKNNLHCSCEKDCIRFKSCCMDWGFNRNETMSVYVQKLLKKSARFPMLDCKHVAVGLPSDYRAEKILMRSSCPGDAIATLQDACSNELHPLAMQPVLGNDGFIYKNQHCAACNNIVNYKRLELEAKLCDLANANGLSLSIGLDGTTAAPLHFTQTHRNCFIALKEVEDKIENKSIRRCSINVHSSSNQPPSLDYLDYQLCQSYQAGVLYNSTCYKNFHCLKTATGKKLSFLTSRLQPCFDSKPKSRTAKTGTGFTFIVKSSYSQLVSFDDLYRKTECGSGKIFDSGTKRCVKFGDCGASYRLVGNECVKIKTNTPKQGLPNSKIQLSQEEILKNCLSSTVNILIHDEAINEPLHFDTEMVSNTSSGLLLVIDKIKERNITKNLKSRGIKHFEVISSTVAQHYFTELYGFDVHRTFSSGKLCSDPVVLTNISFSLSANCWLLLKDQIRLSPKDFILNVIKTNDKDYATEIVKCNNYHLDSNCLKRTLTNFELKENGTLRDNDDNLIFESPEMYIPLSKGIGVCITTPIIAKLKSWQKVTNGVESYLTLVGCLMSLFCYVWVMLTYTIIPALKTIPGKNIVCLCSVLASCDIILLLSRLEISFKVCAALGVLLHYFVLSAQVWSSIVAFDIWSTFRGQGRMMNGKSNKRFHIYLAVGYFIPAIIISVCVTLELTNSINFGYGINGICWIAVFQPRLVAYILPMVLITLFNVSVLSYTISTIFKHNRKSKKLLKKSGGQDISLAKMTLKLVILLGAIEILGLIQIPNADENGELIINSIFGMIFTIVRAFRGVFIWLLYIVSDRVFNVYKEVVRQGSLRATSRTTFSSSSTRATKRSTFRSEDSTISDNHKLIKGVAV